MIYYCKSCGGKTESLTELKFCGQCGQSLHQLYKAIAQKNPPNKTITPKIIIHRTEEIPENIEEEITSIPNIESLEVEVGGLKPNDISLGQLAKQKKTGYKRQNKSNLPKSKKEFLEFWAKDAGSMKRGETIDIGEKQSDSE